MSKLAERISPREQRLLVAFAFFAELMLGYFLLVDPDMTRLQRLGGQLAEAQKAVAALEATTNAPMPVTPGGAFPSPLPLKAGESPDLVLQRFLAAEINAAGATPMSISLPSPAPGASPMPFRRARVEASGPYPAVGALVGRLGQPPYRMAIDTLEVKPAPDDAKQLQVLLELSVDQP